MFYCKTLFLFFHSKRDRFLLGLIIFLCLNDSFKMSNHWSLLFFLISFKWLVIMSYNFFYLNLVFFPHLCPPPLSVIEKKEGKFICKTDWKNLYSRDPHFSSECNIKLVNKYWYRHKFGNCSTLFNQTRLFVDILHLFGWIEDWLPTLTLNLE